MKRQNKKGFTIVELVIVIAVIAILAAVLIPTFGNVIENARQSSDTQVVRQLNNAIAIESAYNQGKKPATMHDALVIADDYGYNVGKIVAKSKLSIAWDNSQKRFVLLNEAENKFVFPIDELNSQAGEITNKLDYFVVRDSVPENGEYSIYAGPNWKDSKTIEIAVGFDAGDQTFESITYTGSTNAQNVVIRTNSFETLLVVSAPKDTVNHYGFAYIADVQSINSASYHEHGTVGRLKVAQGHAVVESTGTVFCAMDKDGTDTGATINVLGKVYTETSTGENNVNAEVTQQASGVFNSEYKDCGYGHHNMQKLVVDSTHTYEVCTACGYTVKIAGVEGGAVVYHTSDDKNAVASDPEVTVDSTSGEVTINTESATTPIVAGDVNNDIDVEKVNNCEHTFAYADEEGLCVGTCSKCGLKTVQEHHYWDLDGENVGEGAKCVQCAAEPVSGVCKIGNTGYDTLKDAVAAVPTDGTATTIVMIANYGFTENVGVVISTGQNIVFDMNGFVLSSDAPISGNAALFTVKGKMTIKDSSDTNKDGTGKGKITTHIQNPDQSLVPGYASNTIYVNGGELTLESGIVENYSPVLSNGLMSYGASYCVDIGGWLNPAKDSIFTMNGGRLIGEYADGAVRLNNQTGTSCKCIFNMTGGVIESGGFWLQQGGGSSTPGEINISGGVVNGLIDLACFDVNTEKVTISGDAIINCTKLRIRRFGGDGKTSTQSADKFVFISCKEFNVTTFDSTVEKNYTQASEYKIFISIDDNTTLSGVATQLK